MKKLIIAATVVMAGAFGIFQANNNNAQMSELQLENAELLAQGESLYDYCPYFCYTSNYCYCDLAYRSNPSSSWRCYDRWPY